MSHLQHCLEVTLQLGLYVVIEILIMVIEALKVGFIFAQNVKYVLQLL